MSFSISKFVLWITLSEFDLERARVRLGVTYPAPIIDHAHARERALQALESTKNAIKGNLVLDGKA